MNIPEKAVEAAAQTMCAQDLYSPGSLGPWGALPHDQRWSYLRDARRVLEAAYPHIVGDAQATE